MADRRKRLMKPEKGKNQYGDRSVTDMSMDDAFNDTISKVKILSCLFQKEARNEFIKFFDFYKYF